MCFCRRRSPTATAGKRSELPRKASRARRNADRQDSLGRADRKRIEGQALTIHAAYFEGIVNAICHRDYTSNASVQVMLFRDRLEILSPGRLPKGMTVSLLHRRHRSIPVNPLLARGMFYRGYIEKVGSGTGDMLEKCRAAGTPAPQWIEEDDGFTVVLRKLDFASISGEVEETGMKTGTNTTQKSTQKTPGKPPENPQRNPQKI